GVGIAIKPVSAPVSLTSAAESVVPPRSMPRYILPAIASCGRSARRPPSLLAPSGALCIAPATLLQHRVGCRYRYERVLDVLSHSPWGSTTRPGRRGDAAAEPRAEGDPSPAQRRSAPTDRLLRSAARGRPRPS